MRHVNHKCSRALSRSAAIFLMGLLACCDLLACAIAANYFELALLSFALLIIKVLVLWRGLRSHFDSAIHLYTLFAIFIIFFYFGKVVVSAAGSSPKFMQAASPAAIFLSTVIANSALSGFFIGGLFAILISGSHRKFKLRPPRNLRWLERIVPLIATLLCMLFVANSLPLIDQSLAGGYMKIYGNHASVVGGWRKATADMLVPMLFLMILLYRDRHKIAPNILLLIITGVIVGISLVIGVKSAAVLPALGVAYLYRHKFAGRRFKYLVAFGAVFAFVLLPYLSYARTLSGYGRFSINQFLHHLFDGGWAPLALFQETGFTLDTIALTIDLARAEPLRLGSSYLQSFYNTIPMTFADAIGWDQPQFIADWLVKTVDPGWRAVGGGFGFSFIGEAFINFGYLGPSILSALLGFGFCRLALRVTEGDWYCEYLEALMTVQVLIFVRSESLGITRGVVWLCVLPYVALCFAAQLPKPILAKASHSLPAPTT